jgi:hypothetical protein
VRATRAGICTPIVTIYRGRTEPFKSWSLLIDVDEMAGLADRYRSMFENPADR